MATAKSLLSGWRASATGLLLTTLILTIILCSLLLASLFKLGNGWSSTKGTSQFFSGDCTTASRLNLGLHLIINIMGSIILASSNFFMQILLAPTRSDIDKAHARSRFAEIGVQSFRNLRVVPAVNIALWLLLAISSVPLHLVFNTCVLEARGSTKNLVVMASKGFTEGAPYMPPGVGRAGYWEATEEQNITLSHIQTSLLNSTWEKLSLPECWTRYNDSEAILTNYRHVILVMNNQDESDTVGWTVEELRYNTTDERTPSWVLNFRNSLWGFTEFDKTDSAMNGRAGRYTGETLDSELEENYFRLDLTSGVLTAQKKADVGNGYFPIYNDTYHSPYNEGYWTFDAPYCLSEPLVTPCRLEVENSLLGIVCLMCILKLVFGFTTVLLLRKKTPLATPGDAIESFILTPDSYTKGMCSFSRSDFARQLKTAPRWHVDNRPWKKSSRRYMAAVPRLIWAWTYSLITLGIIASIVFFYEALRTRSVSKSFFGHNPKNANVYIGGFMENTNNAPSTVSIAILANMPQLIVSVLYLAYNGIFTRIFAEIEWARYSQAYKPLRVTQRKGEQVSTYRLQLPLHWSIPLLVVSTLLHWLLSNCFYVIIYETYDAYYPYAISIIKWLQYSTQAILISLLVGIVLAVVPIVLSLRKVPGQMVMAGSCSAVLSAACHCITSTTTSLLKTNEEVEVSVDETTGNELWRIATGKVKWGVINRSANVFINLDGDVVGSHGHLGFGTIFQEITEPEEGKVYDG